MSICRDLRIRYIGGGYLEIRMNLSTIRCLKDDVAVTKVRASLGWDVTVVIDPYDGARTTITGNVPCTRLEPEFEDFVEDVTPRPAGSRGEKSYLVVHGAWGQMEVVDRCGSAEEAVRSARRYSADGPERSNPFDRVMAVRVDGGASELYFDSDFDNILWDSMSTEDREEADEGVRQ